jgi:hypothetical protein
MGGFVLATLIGVAGLAVVWLQTTPKPPDSTLLASVSNSKPEPASPATEPAAKPPEPVAEVPKATPVAESAPPAEAAPPPVDVTEAKRPETVPSSEPKSAQATPPEPEPEEKAAPPTKVAKADPPKEMAKVETPKEMAKAEAPVTKAILGKPAPKSAAAEKLLPVKKLDPKVEEKVKASLQWLKAKQREDGAWVHEVEGALTMNAVMTSFAAMAMIANGDPAYDDSIHKAARYVTATIFHERNAEEDMRPSNVNWKFGIGGLFLCEYYAWRKAREPDFDSKELDGVLDRLVEEIFRRMEPSGGWGHSPRMKNPLGYLELQAVSQWMMAAAGAAERLGRKLPADKVKQALQFAEDCCSPGTGAVGYSSEPRLKGKLSNGSACPGRIGGALFGYALLKQQKHPQYLRMTAAYNQTMNMSNEGHGSLCLVMLASGMGARQLSDQTWKAFQDKFFTQVMGGAQADGSFEVLTGKSINASISGDKMVGITYVTAVYSLILQLDTGRLRFAGQRHS